MAECIENTSPAVQPSPVVGKGVTGPSSTTLMSPQEMSSTEAPSNPGTPVNFLHSPTPPTQPENRLAEFMQSMTAMLEHSPKKDLYNDQVAKDQDQQKDPDVAEPMIPGPSSVRDHRSVAPSSVPSQDEMSVQSVMPGTVTSRRRSFEQGSADISSMTSALPENFKIRLVLHADSSEPGLPSQVSGLDPAHPAFEAGNGFASSPSNAPSARVPLRKFLKPLKEGDMPRPRPNLAGIPRSFSKDSQQTPLKSVSVEKLSDSDVLFYFTTMCFMAQLSPQYTFKYGGKEGKMVGVRLMMYGHTVLVAADSESAHIARVKACRQALLELQQHNPQWQVPPVPFSGPGEQRWSWPQMLEAFCNEVGWPKPQYRSYEMNNQWHTEVAVADLFFRTFKGCGSVKEAYSTVCHHAFYDLVTTDNIEVGRILHAGSPLLSLPKVKGPVGSPAKSEHSNPQPVLNAVGPSRSCPEETGKAQILQDTVDGLNCRLRNKETKPAGKVSGLAAGKIAKQPAKPALKQAQQKPANPSPKTSTPSRRQRRKNKAKSVPPAAPPQPKDNGKGKGVKPPGPEASARGANMVPLQNSRLAPVELKEEPVVDQLATLKAVQDAILGLSPRASYHRLMKTICLALKIAEPEFRYPPAPANAVGFTHAIQAHWDDPTPYLRRASPVNLANIRWVDKKAAEALGEKKVILFLLRMCKDEVNEDLLDKKWEKELGGLSRLEDEIRSNLRRTEKKWRR